MRRRSRARLAVPFLLGAEHGFLVAGAHDDAVHVGGGGVLRVVFVEGVAPHGGPQVVALAAQEQFKDVGVELVAVVGDAGPGGSIAVLGADVVGQGGGFVVEEDAAVLDGRLADGELAGLDVEFGVFLGGDIGPVVPGGLAGLFRKVVDAVDGAALVGAGR